MENINIKYISYIDWMKSVAMLLIVWGHFFPPHVSKYLYGISVPIFFLISGFLTKNNLEWNSSIRKQWHGLILPYFIFTFTILIISYLESSFHNFSIGNLSLSLFAIVAGIHTFEGQSECNVMWFVYLLFFVKFIFFITNKHKHVLVAIIIISVTVAGIRPMVSLGDFELWSFPSFFLAFPLFTLGNFMHNCRFPILTKYRLIYLFAISIAIYYFSVRGNSEALLYYGSYGNNYFRYWIGVISGTIALYCFCKLLPSIRIERLISKGTILILALHIYEIEILKLIYPDVTKPLTSFIASIIILLLLIPLISLASKYLPVLIGKR